MPTARNTVSFDRNRLTVPRYTGHLTRRSGKKPISFPMRVQDKGTPLV